MDSPAFGQADLSNCERELIHFAGSVQPHGALLVLREPDLVVVQASSNCANVFGPGRAADKLLGQPLRRWSVEPADSVPQLLDDAAGLADPQPLAFTLQTPDGARLMEGNLHRHAGGGLVLELEPVDPPAPGQVVPLTLPHGTLMATIAAAVQRLSAASTIGTLADARDPRLESLLGHRYPATDIPQRARELYLRNRVRVLVDVHYEPQPLIPALLPLTGQPLDMSLCSLRSMLPLHLPYLKNMGVAGTLVASLVRDGKLWGLVAAHHYSPRNLRFALRAAVDLLAEVASTPLAAIENYVHAQVALMVRRLEQRLIEATSTEGDWRQALFRNPPTLLRPLEATGAALFHDGEFLTSGEVPSTPELRALLPWVDAQVFDAPFACSSVGHANPALQSLTPTASGVLAVELSTSPPDYLMWFRKEQLLTVTWAGNPAKPMVNDDPLQLSPRRSFEAWSEIVRGTAVPWSTSEVAMARAIGTALVDIIVQVHAVRLLIAEHRLTQIRATVATSREAVLIGDGQGQVLFANEAFERLAGRGQL